MRHQSISTTQPWLVEASLWLKWQHVGTASSSSASATCLKGNVSYCKSPYDEAYTHMQLNSIVYDSMSMMSPHIPVHVDATCSKELVSLDAAKVQDCRCVTERELQARRPCPRGHLKGRSHRDGLSCDELPLSLLFKSFQNFFKFSALKSAHCEPLGSVLSRCVLMPRSSGAILAKNRIFCRTSGSTPLGHLLKKRSLKVFLQGGIRLHLGGFSNEPSRRDLGAAWSHLVIGR